MVDRGRTTVDNTGTTIPDSPSFEEIKRAGELLEGKAWQNYRDSLNRGDEDAAKHLLILQAIEAFGSFVRRYATLPQAPGSSAEDFLNFLEESKDAAFRVAKKLRENTPGETLVAEAAAGHEAALDEVNRCAAALGVLKSIEKDPYRVFGS